MWKILSLCIISCVTGKVIKGYGMLEDDYHLYTVHIMKMLVIEHTQDLVETALTLSQATPEISMDKQVICFGEEKSYSECNKQYNDLMKCYKICKAGCKDFENGFRLKCFTDLFSQFMSLTISGGFNCAFEKCPMTENSMLYSGEILLKAPEDMSENPRDKIWLPPFPVEPFGGDIILEAPEEIENIDLDDELDSRMLRNLDNTCDFTQFGQNHTANLPPKEKCEKFRMIAGEIYKRGVSEEDIQAILKTHNELRSRVAVGNETRGNPGPQPSGANISELKWNDQLAIAAQGWASQCAVEHDKQNNRKTCTYKFTGQNVGHTWRHKDDKPTTVYWENTINAFYNEVENMPNSFVDKKQKPPKGMIGHYTQVIWAKTYEIGCGAVYYNLYEENNKGKIITRKARSYVCNYGPPGNYKKAKVYERGQPASNCINGVSSSYPNLCAQPEPATNCENGVRPSFPHLCKP